MPSASFTVNTLATPPERAVAAGSTVALALVSTSGVNTVQWSFVSDSADALSTPTITTGGTPDGATASFTMPAGAAQGFIVQCIINNGTDAEGNPQSAYTKKALIGVVGAAGIIPATLGEKYERDSVYGWQMLLVRLSTGMVIPQVGNNLADADATIIITGGAVRVIPAGTLTANRVIDVDNTSAIDNEEIVIARYDVSAFTVTVRDNSNATVFTMPASTAMALRLKKATGANFADPRAIRLATV